jgi:D-sedoheptulose 7-phosphate isomerase
MKTKGVFPGVDRLPTDEAGILAIPKRAGASLSDTGAARRWRSAFVGVKLPPMAFDSDHVRARLRTSAQTLDALGALADGIADAANALARASAAGGIIYTCGNGGSAAQALHLSEELVGKYKSPRPPIGAVCLNADPTALTCIANDFGFDQVFARQAQALVREGDALVVLSTSGASPNVRLALGAARERGALTLALLGRDGGACKDLADYAIVVPADASETIQEAHQVLVHLLVEGVESCR